MGVEMARGQPVGTAETATAILDIAERLVQQRGFNGFSYADISAELGITKASLHYHFPSKAELGEELINRYSARFSEALAEIDESLHPTPRKLQAYCDIYRAVLSEERMCLCGMLAAEYDTLPEQMRASVVAFFDYNHVWLSRVLENGRAIDEIHFIGSADHAARSVVASLEGAMLVSRPYHDTTMIDSVTERIIAEFSIRTARRRAPKATTISR
jgi:TetR/AcrR family transcriptional regulator, transcriptional repressor for nem operon